MVEWTEVESSNIAGIAYIKEAEQLMVQFNSGSSIYAYSDVPEQVYQDFLDADSKGKFLNERIKGKYQYEKA